MWFKFFIVAICPMIAMLALLFYGMTSSVSSVNGVKVDDKIDNALQTSLYGEIPKQISEIVSSASGVNWVDMLSVLPESYLLSMLLIALVLVGMSNFGSTTTNVVKKTIVTSALYPLTINTMWMTSLICIVQFWLFSEMIGINLMSSLINFQSYSIIDMYTLSIKLLILWTTILILKSSEDLLKKHPRHLIEYPILILLTTLFLMILISAYNFITVFLAIIGFSLNIYVLLLYNSFNHASREAGIKYFYLSSISSGLLISGIFFSYLIFNSTSFMSISLITA